MEAVKENKRQKKAVSIDKEACAKLERLHYEYNSYLEVEKGYLDGHMLDESGDAIGSPVYAAYHEKTVAALKAYEEAKADLVEKYGLGSASWNLDFKTGEVTVG